MYAERSQPASSLHPHSCQYASELRVPCQPPFSFRKRSATPDFGLSEEGSDGQIRPSASVMREYHPESGLSSIHTSVDSEERKPEESRDIIGLLQAGEAGENSLRLSPVIQRKTCSRLDESSIVDPSSHIVLEPKRVDKSLVREMSKLREAINEEHLAFQQRLNSQASLFEEKIEAIFSCLNATQRKQENRVFTLRQDIASFKQPDRDKENQGLVQAFQQDIAAKEKEHIEAANQTLLDVKRNYETKLQRQHDQLRQLRHQNAALKSKLDDVAAKAGAGKQAEEEEKQLLELKEENVKLKMRLVELKRVAGCPRCSSSSRNGRRATPKE